MNESIKNGADYIGYEYKEVVADRDKEGVYADGYPNFGWVQEKSPQSIFGFSTVNLKFKRNRKILNKAELTRLQRQFESNVAEIEKLEQSKTTKAIIVAFTIGILGAAAMAGAVFAFLANIIPLCIVLAVPAFIGWAVPYFMYIKLTNKRVEAIKPLIEQQYDSIYEVCEKAHNLLT